jgi:hypothetical protein
MPHRISRERTQYTLLFPSDLPLVIAIGMCRLHRDASCPFERLSVLSSAHVSFLGKCEDLFTEKTFFNRLLTT